MKKIFMIIILSVFGLTPAFGQFNWETNIRLENNIGQKFNINYLGVKQNATDGLDFNLGEEDLPTIPVPDPELSAVFYINNDVNTWSYREYRAVPDSNNFKKIYTFAIEYGSSATTVDVTWDHIGTEVDSAYIEDIYEDIFIYKVDMKKNQSVHLTNHAANLQKITIWYNKSGTGVVENSEKNDIFVYPNPAEDNILLENASMGENLKIYNQLGICVLDTNYLGEKINISKLDAGLYFIKSNNRLSKFIKL